MKLRPSYDLNFCVNLVIMFAVAPTDLDWFQQLRTEGVNGNVINFQSKVKEREKIILKNGVSEIS